MPEPARGCANGPARGEMESGRTGSSGGASAREACPVGRRTRGVGLRRWGLGAVARADESTAPANFAGGRRDGSWTRAAGVPGIDAAVPARLARGFTATCPGAATGVPRTFAFEPVGRGGVLPAPAPGAWTRGASARKASRCESGPPASSARNAVSSSRTSAPDPTARARSSAVRSNGPSPFTVEIRVKSRWARKRRGATSGCK
jgi:hypothetical protein